MGLDNIPEPYPCVIKGYAKYTDDGRIDCDKTNCPFKNIKHTIGIFGTYCWLRGKVYNRIVVNATNEKYSLYEPLTVRELKEILEAVKNYRAGNNYEEELRQELVAYLEVLLGEVGDHKDFILKPWF